MSLINNDSIEVDANGNIQEQKHSIIQMTTHPNEIPEEEKIQCHIHQQSNSFTKQYSTIKIECIAPTIPGNYITAMAIDEIYGWLIVGQSTGTINVWKISSHSNIDHKHRYICHILCDFEEDGIRHLFLHKNKLIAMVGYHHLCLWTDYNKSSLIKMKLFVLEVFNYSPFQSPHFFYTILHQNIIHIYCQGFYKAMKIDLLSMIMNNEQTKECQAYNDSISYNYTNDYRCKNVYSVVQLPFRMKVLSCNNKYLIWETSVNKNDFIIHGLNVKLSKMRSAIAHGNVNVGMDDEKKEISKVLDQISDLRRKETQNSYKKQKSKIHKIKRKWVGGTTYKTPCIKLIEVRMLSNIQPVHHSKYFMPFNVNSWGFQLSNKWNDVCMDSSYSMIETTMVYVRNGNQARIMKLCLMADEVNGRAVDDSVRIHLDMDVSCDLNESGGSGLCGVCGGVEMKENVAGQVMDESVDENIEDVCVDNIGKCQKQEIYDLRGHRGYILCFEYCDDILVTLGSDHKICVWMEGEIIGCASDICGRFIAGYPYIVKRGNVFSNTVYYTADDGIFKVQF